MILTSGASVEALVTWKFLPGRNREQIVRQIGDEMRSKRDMEPADLAGDVQDHRGGRRGKCMDISVYATGQSRIFEGRILPSERAGHVLLRTWNPLGCVGFISAFTFPMGVCGCSNALAMI